MTSATKYFVPPCDRHFAVHRQLGWKDGDLRVAEKIGRSLLSLPLFPGMPGDDVTRVVALAGILRATAMR